MMRCRILFSALLLLVTLMAYGQADDRRITNVQTVSVGTSNILDSYLSQEKYHGTELRYLSHTTRHLSDMWKEVLIHQGIIANVNPRSEDNTEQLGMYLFDYGRYKQIKQTDKLHLFVGGMAEIGGGFLYNTRNTNNPAQGRLYLHVSPSVIGEYSFTLFHKSLMARYELSVPLLGALFTPNYGQSYYEIFSEGNYDHNIILTTPLNAPSLRHSITVDIPFSRVDLRVGYLGDYQQAKANNLKYHTYSHLLTVGIVRNFTIHPITR